MGRYEMPSLHLACEMDKAISFSWRIFLQIQGACDNLYGIV